jgi:homoserine O-acetyltransferase
MRGNGMSSEPQTGEFALGDFAAEKGGTIRGGKLVWQTHGRLNETRDNVILYPSSYSAQHQDMAWLIGEDGILDPTRWFIVTANMFSNGLSSGAAETEDYPKLVTLADNVRAQKRLLAEHFGIERLACVYGFSMGAMQAYHWAALFPDMVERAVVACGSARTAPHNKVFLSGLLRILEAAPDHVGDGRFSTEPKLAVKAFGHVYAGWGLSQDFYREGLHRTALGAPDLESFIKTDWADRFAMRRAANLYAQALAWYHGDISDNALYGGDLEKALRAIRAKVLLLPGATDLYFRVADNELELKHLGHGELRPIPSVWGHRAGNPATNPADAAFLKAATREWLSK